MPKVKAPGQVIREFREKKRPVMTLAELAKLTRIDQADLSRIENGKLAIGAKRALRISRNTGIDFDRLFKDKPTHPADVTPASDVQPAGAVELPTQTTTSPTAPAPTNNHALCNQ